MTRHITAGIDGSLGSDVALDWAVAEAVREHAPLEIVHALDLSVPANRSARTVVEYRLSVDLEKYSQDLLDAAQRHAFERAPGLEVWTRTEIASPISALVEASEDASEIVVGRRGAGAFDGFVGSVSAKTALRAHCPVIVVPDDDHPVSGTAPIVVGVDDTPTCRVALRYALRRAAQSSAAIRVVGAYTVPALTIPLTPKVQADLERQERDDTASSVAAQLSTAREGATAHVDVQVVVAAGAPAKVILNHAGDAQLIVVGSHGRGPVRRALLGSVSHRLLHEAPCPVAVLGPDVQLADTSGPTAPH